MTEQEKHIYNNYLIVTRSKQGKPFKVRKDFDKFEENKCYSYVKRLCSFFNRYPHIKVKEFFEAPYEIYSDTQHVSIDYYLTRAAIKAYSLYQKKIQDLSPDHQIESIRSSLQHIGSFCMRNNLTLEQYVHHKTGCIYTWMLHYREHQINIYSLFEMGDILSIVSNTPTDERELLTDDLSKVITTFKTRYTTSSTAKQFVKEGTNRLKRFLKESLNSCNSPIQYQNKQNQTNQPTN